MVEDELVMDDALRFLPNDDKLELEVLPLPSCGNLKVGLLNVNGFNFNNRSFSSIICLDLFRMDISISRRRFSSASDILFLVGREWVVVCVFDVVVVEDVELWAASNSNIDWAIVFLGLAVVAVGLDDGSGGGSDDKAVVGGCSEELQVSTPVCCLVGSSDDDGTSSAVPSLLVFQLGLTMLVGNNAPSFYCNLLLGYVSSYLVVYDAFVLCLTFVVPTF